MGQVVQIGEGEPIAPSGLLDVSYEIPPAPALPALAPLPIVALPPPPVPPPPPLPQAGANGGASLTRPENVVLDLSPVLLVVRVPETGELLGMLWNPFKPKKEGDWFPGYSILTETEMIGLGLGAGVLVYMIVKRRR